VTAPAPHAAPSKVMPAAGWPGRPSVEVPGLEQPAQFVHAALTLDDIGHRAILVIASEAGDAVTTDQLAALADALDEMYGEEAPRGSRAWLRDQVAKYRDEIDRLHRQPDQWKRRAEQAEAAIRDRSAVDDAGLLREALSLDLGRTREALREQQRRTDRLHTERDELAGRVEELTAMLEQARHERDTLRAQQNEHVRDLMAAIRDDGPYPRGPIADHLHNLRGRAEVAEQARDRVVADRVVLVEALMAEKDAHQTTRETRDYIADRLAHAKGQRDAQAERAEDAEARYRGERDACRNLAGMWRSDSRVRAHQLQAATQRGRRHTVTAALAGVLAGALTTLAARRNR
jgi:hypothetical protein